MVVRFKKDNMSYGTVGDPIVTNDYSTHHIGDICKVKMGNGLITDCMVVMPEWNKSSTLMGIGELGFNEEILSIVPYTNLKVGDEHRKCLIITEN